jgi:hypothetical protein
MEQKKINFKDCNKEYLEYILMLEQKMKSDLLADWIEKTKQYSINVFEDETVTRLQEKLGIAMRIYCFTMV